MPADTMAAPPSPTAETAASTSVTAAARARRVWRRAGVRRTDRAPRAAELTGEIEAAAADGS